VLLGGGAEVNLKCVTGETALGLVCKSSTMDKDHRVRVQGKLSQVLVAKGAVE